VCPESPIHAPHWVVGSAPRVDLACRFRNTWRSSRLLHSISFHTSSLQFSSTAWALHIYTTLPHSCMTPCVSVSDCHHASVAFPLIMYQWWCSLNVRWACIRNPSHLVASLLHLMKQCPTPIFAVNFGRWCMVWPCLQVKHATSVSVPLNSIYCLSAQSMLTLAQTSSFLKTWFMLLPVATCPTSSAKAWPSTSEIHSDIHLMSPDVFIATRSEDTCEPCGIVASTGCLFVTLPSVTLSTVRSLNNLAIQLMRSPFIPFPVNVQICHPLPTLGKAAWFPSGVHQLCGLLSRVHVLCWPWLQLGRLPITFFCFLTGHC